MKRCSSCGSDAAENSRFCNLCGAPIVLDVYATRTLAATQAIASTSGNRSVSSRFSTSAADSQQEERFPPGSLLINRYRVISLLGKGGMGEVYRADDLALGQSVALKFLPESLSNNDDALMRFRNEVRVARQVSHPNVCRVHDVGEVDGHIFLSMEYVDGEDLASLLRRIGRLPEDKALEIARKLCAGLAAAHEKGVLHRDLKPSNVMLDGRGQVLLTDFGLAGLSDQIAGNEVRSGTPAYMAPEQMEGKEVTTRSDIYSLGLVLYELFTGKRPFEGETLAELVRARLETTPASLSSHVRDLDPAVERVILRCLEREPLRRPVSALSISAALPGGDPLTAALAAGETPSPEMVAAAGEGSGLAVKFAIPLYLVVVAGIAAHVFYLQREVALDRLGTFYSPEVLEHKAREMLRSFGGNEPVADSVRGLDWNWSFFDHVKAKDKPVPDWNQILPGRPPVVKFWYRESPAPLVAGEFHDDLLTPGMVDAVDPPGILAGMRSIELDKEGRLISFFRVPPERTEGPKPPSAVDWAPFFNAAGLDPAQLRPATAKGAWLEAADLREAWSGVWPGTTRPLHVEAAAWQGQPVVFAVQGSWSTLWRTPRPPSARGQTSMLILCSLAVTTIVASSLLARRNVLRGRGDRSGAMRLAAFMFAVHMTLWLTRSHFAPSLGTFGMFLLALCTSIAYAVLVWTLYMAIEPYVRRHWPHTIISWTRVLSGRLRDPIVGRDILIGAAVSLCWRFLGHVSSALDRSNMPDFISPTLLLGARSTLGEYLENVPHAIRETLLFFFILFLFRVILRNQWAAAVAFASIFVALNIAGGGLDPVRLATASVVFLSISLLVVRFGLLALASAYLIDGTLGDMPVTFQPSQWYFFSFALLMVLTLGLVTWAFKQAVSGQKWFGEALFD